ncbi:CDP-diacylglycerol--glycerol-3-phosphate 3-phosphatidyltransferase [Nocardioidaceae bacterium]|nr:CDP-diacylglycerol--glycerol-3-phosphate 3-phosphatidyltransferase [Nocardioidaceae bacterium]
MTDTRTDTSASGPADRATSPSNWNLPNVLTASRIVVVPVFGWVLLQDGGDSVGWRWLAVLLFSLAMYTDKLDGDIARSRGQVTDFGKIADPVADKALTGMAFIGLAVIDELFAWVAVVVIVRELAVTVTRMAVRRRVVIAADKLGKIKTVLQSMALAGLLMPLRLADGAWEVPGLIAWWVAVALMAAAVVMTIVSGAQFFRQVVRGRRVDGDGVPAQS